MESDVKARGVKNLKALSGDVQHALERHTPVRNGLARRSWRSKKVSSGYEIYNSQPYTVYLEKGSSRQRPRGITKPAIQALKARRKLK